MATATATPWVTGPVTVQATVDGVTDQATFIVVAKDFLVTILSGDQQSVTGAAALRPVVAQVTNMAGQPVSAPP